VVDPDDVTEQDLGLLMAGRTLGGEERAEGEGKGRAEGEGKGRAEGEGKGQAEEDEETAESPPDGGGGS
jgi:hypothetical protein